MKNGDWILVSNGLPNSGERCLVSDGDVVVVATYISDTSGRMFWIFGEKEDKTFDVQAWSYLPKPPEKIQQIPNEIVVAKDKTSN